MTRFQGKLPFGRGRCDHRGRRGKDWGGDQRRITKCAAVRGSYWKSSDGIERRHREELTHIYTAKDVHAKWKQMQKRRSQQIVFIRSIIPKDFFFFSFISNVDKCLSASCAEQMNHHGRDMLCGRQQWLDCARYLPRLSDCGALVGVLLVFILFKAPLTKSETRNKPNGVKHLWQDDVIHPLTDQLCHCATRSLEVEFKFLPKKNNKTNIFQSQSHLRSCVCFSS